MNFALMLDKKLADGVETLAPHFSAFTLKRPFQVSGDIQFPKPVLSTFANYLHYKEAPDPEKLRRMQEAFG